MAKITMDKEKSQQPKSWWTKKKIMMAKITTAKNHNGQRSQQPKIMTAKNHDGQRSQQPKIMMARQGWRARQ